MSEFDLDLTNAEIPTADAQSIADEAKKKEAAEAKKIAAKHAQAKTKANDLGLSAEKSSDGAEKPLR